MNADGMTGVSAADALAPGAPVDSKTDLNQFCQRYCKRPVTKQDIVYVVNRFGHQYQSIVKLNCFSGQEYAGHLCMSSKDAEKSAASQALVAYGPTIETLGSKEDAQKQRKKAQQSLTPEELAVKKERQTQEGENPAITPKTKLNSLCMKIAKRYLQKGETIYDSMKVTGGYQATVRLGALPGAWAARCWAGEVCSTKQKAEQSAAEIALSQVLSDPELAEEASKPKGKGEEDKGTGKGKGKGGKGYWSGYYGGWVWQGPSDEDSGPAPARELVSEERLAGEVVEWKETHGWIKASSDIDHPAAGMRRGKIYMAKKDLPEGVTELLPGTAVEFVVYEDGSGLGAGEVTLL